MKTILFQKPQQPVIDIVKIDKQIVQVLERARNKRGNKGFATSACTQVMSKPWVDDAKITLCTTVHAKGYGKLCSAQSILWYLDLPITKACAAKFHEELTKLIEFAATDALTIIRDKKNVKQKLIICKSCKYVTINKNGESTFSTETSGE